MSLRSHGMVGKTYRTSQEAFKDANYAEAIERPQKEEKNHIGAILVCLISVAFVVALFIHF